MKTATFAIKGISPYSQSRFHDTPKEGKETNDDHERRTWKNRIHVGSDGDTFMPQMAIKKSLEGAAPYLGKIPGQRNATYTKRFKSGILITEELPLFNGKSGKRAGLDSWKGQWLFLDANGKPGGTRVKRCMPELFPWSATGVIHVLDEVITDGVLRRCFQEAGSLVGVGRFRPANGGFYGRFALESLEWS